MLAWRDRSPQLSRLGVSQQRTFHYLQIGHDGAAAEGMLCHRDVCVINCSRFDPSCSPAQVYDRKSRLQQRRRSTQRYKGPFTYWDLHDFAALVVVAACLSYCGFKLGVRRGSQAPSYSTRDCHFLSLLVGLLPRCRC